MNPSFHGSQEELRKKKDVCGVATMVVKGLLSMRAPPCLILVVLLTLWNTKLSHSVESWLNTWWNAKSHGCATYRWNIWGTWVSKVSNNISVFPTKVLNHSINPAGVVSILMMFPGPWLSRALCRAGWSLGCATTWPLIQNMWSFHRIIPKMAIFLFQRAPKMDPTKSLKTVLKLEFLGKWMGLGGVHLADRWNRKIATRKWFKHGNHEFNRIYTNNPHESNPVKPHALILVPSTVASAVSEENLRGCSMDYAYNERIYDMTTPAGFAFLKCNHMAKAYLMKF